MPFTSNQKENNKKEKVTQQKQQMHFFSPFFSERQTKGKNAVFLCV